MPSRISLLSICNTLNDLSNKACVPNKTEDLNLSLFNMITGINESKTLIKHISCESKCKCDRTNVSQINGGITISIDVSVKNIMYVKKIIWIPATCNCGNGKHLPSVIDDSVIMCD